jgi:hypothetical protein
VSFVLPAALDEGKKALSGLGKDDDFPTADEVIAKFKFNFDLVPVPDKRDIRVELSAEGMKEAQDSVNRLVDGSAKNVLVNIQNRVAVVINKIIEKLTDTSGKGKKGSAKSDSYAIFRDSLIENGLSLVPLIRELNVLDDPQVEGIAKKLEETLKPVEVNRIREDEDYRKEVVEKAKDIGNALSAMEMGGFGVAA